MPRTDTETRCHCGAAYNSSDHCPECGCEQYETINVRDCGHYHADTVRDAYRIADRTGHKVNVPGYGTVSPDYRPMFTTNAEIIARHPAAWLR